MAGLKAEIVPGAITMAARNIKELDTVALTADLPEHRLQRDDIGAAVHLYPDGSMEVEFVTVGGDTVALVHLQPEQIRVVGKKELLQARLMGVPKAAARTRSSSGRQPGKKLRAG